jgi:hypothetical protein
MVWSDMHVLEGLAIAALIGGAVLDWRGRNIR